MVWRLYGFAFGLAVAMTVAAVAIAVGYDLPFRDPDDALGPTWLRLGLIIGAAFLLDVVPRTLRRAGSARKLVGTFRAVVRERWGWRHVGLVTVGLGSWYLTYVAFRNLKSFVPFVNDRLYDAELAAWDRALTFGADPAAMLHDLLGTDVAAHFMSAVYIAWIGFVPLSLAWALVWSSDVRLGAWYVTAIAVDWALGAAAYFALPTLGPIYYDPGTFEDLADTANGAIQTTMWQERLDVLADPWATSAVQTIAAFASLHVGLLTTACLVAHLAGMSARLRWLLWGFLALTVLCTVYLGWHFVIDAIAGVALGALGVVIGALVTGNAGMLRRRRDPATTSELVHARVG